QLLTTTSDVFESIEIVVDSNSTMGKVVSPAVSPVQQSVKPTGGIAKTANVPCSEGGSFDSSINIEGVDNTTELSGIEVLSEKALDANIRFTYRECDEPVHVSYTDNGDAAETNDPVYETDDQGNIIHNLLDGIFSVSLRTSTGSDTNDEDYSVSAFIEMKDYFIQRYSEGSDPGRPDVLNGEVDLSLVTEDGSDYLISLSSNLLNNNNSTGAGFVKTAFLADGAVTLTDSFSFQAYDLSLNGTIRNIVVGGDFDYQIYTTENLVSSGSEGTVLGLLPEPSAGQLAITTSEGNSSTATVTDTGLYVESIINGVVETSTCTWEEVNNNDC
ncbi:MAG TPA: hypothetical protein VIC26_07080, partial [Marinagarivorans sp.]